MNKIVHLVKFAKFVRKNYKLLITISIGFLFLSYFLVDNLIGKDSLRGIKNLFNKNQVAFIKKNFFPYKTISQQEDIISKQKDLLAYYLPKLDEELHFKTDLKDITIYKKEIIELTENLSLEKFKFLKGFYYGIWNHFPGTGYIDFHSNNLVVISVRGILGYTSDINNELFFKQIKNNINNFIDKEQYSKKTWYSLKDLTILKNKIYISYTEEIKEDCWNTSVIFSEMNYENIEFKKLFSSKDCVHAFKNIDQEFTASQSGGRIISFDDNHILLSVGDYRERHLAQKKDNINGKILKININNLSYEIISMGHRNPQGLYFDKENNFVLETEHGPKGGDEINLIELNESEIPNYGWAIVSAGEHYRSTELKYKRYPLYKSHKEHGFIEPLKSFGPGIAISEITKIDNSYYVASSMKDKSLYFFKLDNDKKIINLTRVEVFERVRDVIYKDKKLYMFLEDTASIGILDVSSYL